MENKRKPLADHKVVPEEWIGATLLNFFIAIVFTIIELVGLFFTLTMAVLSGPISLIIYLLCIALSIKIITWIFELLGKLL